MTGKSQGGGVALAIAGLDPRVRAAAIDVPFLCHWRRAVEVTDEHPYREVRHYLSTRREQAERVFATLAYFDGMQFAARAHAPAIFSVGLMDQITPPSTVFAAYNHYAGPHDIRVWPYNGHEAGELHQHAERIALPRGARRRPRLTVRWVTGTTRDVSTSVWSGAMMWPRGRRQGYRQTVSRPHTQSGHARGERCPIR